MSKRTRAVFRRTAGVLLGVFLAAGCGSGPSQPGPAQTPATQSQPASLPIHIGWQPDPNAAFFLAREEHVFERHGLAPNYVKFTAGPPMFAALASGSVDITDMGLSPFVAALAQGMDVVGVLLGADTTPTNGLVVQANSGIKTLKELKGKRVAATKGSGTYYAMMMGLQDAGLGLKDIQYIDMPTPDMVPAFHKGNMDAAWAWSPWQDLMAQAGGIRLSNGEKVGAYAPQVWVARRAFVQQQPEAVRRFIAAYAEGVRDLRGAKEQAAHAMGQQLNVDDATALAIMQQDYYPTLQEEISPDYKLSLTGGGFAKALTKAVDFFYTQGFVKTKPAVDRAFDPALAEQVAKQGQ